MLLFLFPGSICPVAADEGPLPPCTGTAIPSYPATDRPPAVRVWYGGEDGTAWTPPPCVGWKAAPYRILIATAGRFLHESGVDGLLTRVGAISDLTGIRYWSVSRGRWHDLITEAWAVDSAETQEPRPDFTEEELTPERELHFIQKETSPAGRTLYRLQIRERSPKYLAFTVDNAAPVRVLFLTLLEPGTYQFHYTFEQESDHVWRYYAIWRVGGEPSFLAPAHQSSYINRAIAMYRHLAGIPTDRDLPAAP